MFHTGSLWLVNATFEGNMAGAEGPAMISIGLLEGVSNVTFTKNSFHCSAGEYGVINQWKVRSTELERNLQLLAALRALVGKEGTKYIATSSGMTLPKVVSNLIIDKHYY